MKLKKLIISLLAGSSLALGSGLIYHKRKKQRHELRCHRDRMKEIVIKSLEQLARKQETGNISASEVYFFIWVVERVAKRQRIGFPSFNFSVRKGMLTSSKLTFILRRLMKDNQLRLEGNFLIPSTEISLAAPQNGYPHPGRIDTIIEETAAQWTRDFPDEHLVRFSKLFK